MPASTLPHTPHDITYLPSSPLTKDLPAGMNPFHDPLLCDPVTSLHSLSYCVEELVERSYPLKVSCSLFNCFPHSYNSLTHTHTCTHTLTHTHTHTQALPVLWVYRYTAHSHCRSPSHTLLCQSLSLKALTQLHMFPQALSLLEDTLAGQGVPQTASHHDRPCGTSDQPQFNGSLPLTHSFKAKASYSLTCHCVCIIQCMCIIASVCMHMASTQSMGIPFKAGIICDTLF